jgi:thiamine-monophosphate kinase
MPPVKLSQISELSLLENIRKIFPRRSANIRVGIGDDAAVIKKKEQNLIVTTDMMVEGIHFDLTFVTPFQLGFKLISVNVSDIYAMGGRPSYVLLNMALKRNTTTQFLDMFFAGIKEAMHKYDTTLIGGDLSAAKKEMSLSATIIGYGKKFIRRSSAKAGDRIYVTGYLGDSAGGLEILKRIKMHVPLDYECEKLKTATGNRTSNSRITRMGLSPDTAVPLIRRHLMPEARNPEPFIRSATAMMDVSDGLLIDLTRLCKESKVGARVYEEKIPVSPELMKVAACLNVPTLRLALSGGEDYELLFTAPPGKKVKAIYIGDVMKKGMVIVDRSGRGKTFPSGGFQHFGSKKDR